MAGGGAKNHRIYVISIGNGYAAYNLYKAFSESLTLFGHNSVTGGIVKYKFSGYCCGASEEWFQNKNYTARLGEWRKYGNALPVKSVVGEEWVGPVGVTFCHLCLPTPCVGAAFDMATWLSVCLSRWCIILKRLSRLSCDLHQIVAQPF